MQNIYAEPKMCIIYRLTFLYYICTHLLSGLCELNIFKKYVAYRQFDFFHKNVLILVKKGYFVNLGLKKGQQLIYFYF